MYYVIFFNDKKEILKAHLSEEYPKIPNIVYLLKLLEKSDVKDSKDLMMDILTEKEFNEIKGNE